MGFGLSKAFLPTVRYMKFKFPFVFFVFVMILVGGASVYAATGNYGNIPIGFEANLGQAASNIQFLSRGAGYGFFLTKQEAILRLASPKPAEVRMMFVGGSSRARI